MQIQVKRVYEPPSPDDGTRVLVDRMWPRGLKKESAAIDHWLRELAPSSGLRQWFGHRAERWDGFRQRYQAELEALPDAVATLTELAHDGPLTLLYAARDENHNNAVALREYLGRHWGVSSSARSTRWRGQSPRER